MAVATALTALLFLLECAIAPLYQYVLHQYPLSFDFLRQFFHSPWMIATTIDSYLILLPIALWIYYKESNKSLAALRICLLLVFGSIVSCGYIIMQLVDLSPEKSIQDPVFHVLSNSKKDKRRSNGVLSIVSARFLFITLGFLVAATFVYTAITDGSPFRSDIISPWFIVQLVHCYNHAIVFSVWIAYKEQSWISAALWIVLLMCFTSVALYAYIVVQLFHLSPQDPVSLILFKKRAQNEDGGSTEAFI